MAEPAQIRARRQLAALGDRRGELSEKKHLLEEEIRQAVGDARSIGVSIQEATDLLGLRHRQSLYRIIARA
jgi:hypothetical protein